MAIRLSGPTRHNPVGTPAVKPYYPPIHYRLQLNTKPSLNSILQLDPFSLAVLGPF